MSKKDAAPHVQEQTKDALTGTQQVVILFDDWANAFRPQQNHLRKDASWDGCLFETYGAEFRHVCAKACGQPEEQLSVWTVVDADGILMVTSGLHYVNRMGYLITEVPAPDNVMFDIYDERSEVPRNLRNHLVSKWPLPTAA